MPQYSPISFTEPAPPEYIAPYPNPDYWPTAVPGVTIPSWIDFWGGIPSIPIWPPVYPPVLPPALPPVAAAPNNYFAELCCVGFNPEDSYIEAIISIKQVSGYGGGLCTIGTPENVAFWLIEPSLTFNQTWGLDPAWIDQTAPGVPTSPPYPAGSARQFLGVASVNVYDIPRTINTENGTGILKYAVKLQIPPKLSRFIMGCSDNHRGSRLPRLHAVLGWNQNLTNANFNGAGVFWGSVLDSDIQFTKRTFNLGSTRLRMRNKMNPKSFRFTLLL